MHIYTGEKIGKTGSNIEQSMSLPYNSKGSTNVQFFAVAGHDAKDNGASSPKSEKTGSRDTKVTFGNYNKGQLGKSPTLGKLDSSREYAGTIGVEMVRHNGGNNSEEFLTMMYDLFLAIDTNGNGSIDRREIVEFMGRIWQGMDRNKIFNKIDANGDGDVTFVEWIAYWQSLRDYGYTEQWLLAEMERIKRRLK
jgi:hypothetical protein